jgi:hypothetical protein
MATTDVPAFDGAITTTAEQVRRRTKRELVFAQGDCDKATDPEDSNYHQGLVDAYTEVLTSLTAEENAQPEQKVTAIRFVVTYQMMGDMEGHAWAHHVLTSAVKRGKITDFAVLHSLRTVFGIQVVTFTFDVEATDPVAGMLHEEAAAWGTNLANEIVGDSDVEIIAVGGV